MKKEVYTLFLVTLLFACSDEMAKYENVMERVKDELPKTRALDTEDHALGFSYDVTGNYLDRYSIRNSVIDIAKLREYDNKSVIISNEVYGKNQYYYGFSSYEYIKEINEKSGISTSFNYDTIQGEKKSLSFTGSLNKENFTKYELSTKYSYASADIRKDVKWLRLAENVEVLSGFLTDKFKRDVDNMTSPDQFVKDYGTHVLTDITIGGILRIIYSSSIIKEDSKEVKTKTVKAGLKATMKIIGLTADVDKTVTETISTSAEHKEQTIYLEYKGGDGVGGTYNLDTGYPTIDKYSWEKTVTAANAGLTIINWEKAYPIYEFIFDPIKKEKVKEAVIKYIENNQLPEPLQLKPVYEMYDPGMKDRFYVNSWEEVLMQIGKYQNEYWGHRGYILSEPIADSRPVYEMFDPKMKDRFYVWSWEEAQMQVNSYKNENWGHKGYILVQPASNTKPIYEMYDPKMKDRFYVWSWEEVQMQINSYNSQNWGHKGYIYN